jgi:hypothetical protein
MAHSVLPFVWITGIMLNLHPSNGRKLDIALLKASILAALLLLATWLYAGGEYTSLFIVCALTHAVILYWTARRFGFFDARLVFLAVSSFYPFTPVIDIAVLGQEFFNIRHSSLSLLLSMTLFGGFYVFSSLDLRASRPEDRADPFDQVSFGLLAVLLYVAFFVYLFLYDRDIGFAIGNRTRADVVSSMSALFAVTRFGFIIGLVIMVGKLWSMPPNGAQAVLGSISTTGYRLARQTWHIVAALILVGAFLFIDVLFLGDRRLFLSFALASICVIAPRRMPVAAIIGLIALVGGLLTYQILRIFPFDDWGTIIYRVDVLKAISPANVEFGAFGRVADDILSTWPIAQFPTYADAVFTLIPQVLYPDRPEPIGIWFVHSFYPAEWEIGGGYGFNLVIEALLNLGWFGPLILGSLIGLGFNVTVNLTRWHRLIHGLLVFALVFAMRFDMATLLKTVVIVAAMTVGWLILVARPANVVVQARAS